PPFFRNPQPAPSLSPRRPSAPEPNPFVRIGFSPIPPTRFPPRPPIDGCRSPAAPARRSAGSRPVWTARPDPPAPWLSPPPDPLAPSAGWPDPQLLTFHLN